MSTTVPKVARSGTARQVRFQELQRLRGRETYRPTGMVGRVATVQRHINRQIWLQDLQKLRATQTDRQTGMLAKVEKIARYRDR